MHTAELKTSPPQTKREAQLVSKLSPVLIVISMDVKRLCGIWLVGNHETERAKTSIARSSVDSVMQ
jgi:hypothetical protein